MTTTASKQLNVNTAKSESLNSLHPLKNKPFFGIPRHIALLPGITDRVFRLMAILCSAYGDDGHIEYKMATLETLLGKNKSKGHASTRRIIQEAIDLGLITTQLTGRSIKIELSQICFKSSPKLSGQSAQKRALSYKEQKKGLKKNVVAEIGPKTTIDKPLTAAILTTLKNENIKPNEFILQAQEMFGPDYTLKLLKSALHKNPKNPTAYIRTNIKHGQKWESIDTPEPEVIDVRARALNESADLARMDRNFKPVTADEMAVIRAKNYKPARKAVKPEVESRPQAPVDDIEELRRRYIENECKDDVIRDIISKKTNDELMCYPSFKNFIRSKGHK